MEPFKTERFDIEELKKLLPPTCTNVDVFSMGKRGLIFKAKYLDEKALACCSVDRTKAPKELDVAIKVSLPTSQAQSTTMLEGNYLDKVNFYHIGPTVYDYNEHYVIMEFIEGTLIGEWLEEEHSEEEKKIVLENILIQLEILDQVGINKFELTNPYKHIIVKPNLDVVLIDFERARFSKKPKNVNQFKEYVKRKF